MVWVSGGGGGGGSRGSRPGLGRLTCPVPPEDLPDHDIHMDICWKRVTNYVCSHPLHGRRTTYTECCCQDGEAWSHILTNFILTNLLMKFHLYTSFYHLSGKSVCWRWVSHACCDLLPRGRSGCCLRGLTRRFFLALRWRKELMSRWNVDAERRGRWFDRRCRALPREDR